MAQLRPIKLDLVTTTHTAMRLVRKIIFTRVGKLERKVRILYRIKRIRRNLLFTFNRTRGN